MQLIECVPNFSEGRRQDVITAIVSAIAQAGVSLLDVSSDADHNRTVVTFAGTPQQVIEGAFLGIQKAAQLIDLSQHQGQHPRIGATDVVPLIPLRNVSTFECVGYARELGQRVGEVLGLPVYLYEAAALNPQRRSLAAIRRGQYEGLAARIATDPTMQPDFGSPHVGKAGAVVIGVRAPLIAYNAFLDTDDVSIARAIAAQVRESGGGLVHLRALGLLVDGRAQVSMNVMDYRKTSLYDVTEAVRVAAQQHGVHVTETELVGLVPQAALIDAALRYLGLPPQVKEQTLEQRLGAALNDYREIVFE